MDRPKQLLIGLFLIAAAGLAVFGGLSYVDVANVRSASVAPAELRSLTERLDRALAMTSDSPLPLADSDVALIARAFDLAADVQPLTAPQTGGGVPKRVRRRSRTSALPSLAGIIWAEGPDSTRRSRALIGGIGIEEGSMVNGYLLERIEEAGVTLVRGRNRWFVKAPEVGFSTWREGDQ